MRKQALSTAIFALTAITCTSCSQAGGIDAAPSSMLKQSETTNANALPSMVDDAQLSSTTESTTPNAKIGAGSAAPNRPDPYLPPQAVIPQLPTSEARSNTLATPAQPDSSVGADSVVDAQAPRPSRPVPVLPTAPDTTSQEPRPSEQAPSGAATTEPKDEPQTSPPAGSQGGSAPSGGSQGGNQGGGMLPMPNNDPEPSQNRPLWPQRIPTPTPTPKPAPAQPNSEQPSNTEQTAPTTTGQPAGDEQRPGTAAPQDKPFYCSWSNSITGFPLC